MTPGKNIRTLVSLLLAAHLFAVVVGPNSRSYLFSSAQFLLHPWLAGLNLAHSWGFFAPEPISPPIYIDWVSERRGAVSESGRFPDEKNPFFFRDRHNRRMSMSKFIMSKPDNIQNMFMNWQCKKDPSLVSMKVWRVTGIQPTLDMVRSGEKKMTDVVDYKIDVMGSFYCPEVNP